MTTVEKLCKLYTGAKHRRDLKRETRRLRRRAEKRDHESAPTRLREMTRGWSD